MALATLDINLVARLAELQQGMDKAGQIAANTSAAIQAKFNGMRQAALGVGAALAGAISVAGLSNLFRATVDGLDKLNDLADATGATVENLSALEDIAARTGTSVDTVGDALIKLNKSLADAKPGSELAAAFDSIGLSAQELKRLDPAEALRRVAVALSGYADDGDKARKVQEIFGKSLREVAPLLNDLAKSGGLNATVTKEQAEEAEKFNQQLFQLQKNATDAARSLVSDLLPAINQLLVGLKQGGVRGFGDAIGELIGLGKEYYAQRNLVTLAEDLRLLQLQVETAPKGPGKTQLQRELDDKIKAYEQAREQYIQVRGLDQTAPEFRPSQNYGDTRPSVRPTAPPPKVQGASRDRPLKFEMDKATEDALRALQDTDAQKILEINNALDKLFEMRASGAGGGNEIDEAIEKLRTELEKMSPASKAAAEAQKELISLLAATPTGQMEVLQRQASALADELGRAADPTQQKKLEEALGQVYQRMKDLRGEVKPLTEEISEFAQQAARNIQDALGDSVLATMEGNARSIEDIWKNMLKRLVAQAAAAQLGKYLLGDSFGKTGQVGGATGDFFKWLGGLGGGQPTGAASGLDYVPFDGMKAVLHKGERVLTAPEARRADARTGAGGGSSFTINVQGDASENTVRLIRAAIAQYEARQMTRGRA